MFANRGGDVAQGVDVRPVMPTPVPLLADREAGDDDAQQPGDDRYRSHWTSPQMTSPRPVASWRTAPMVDQSQKDSCCMDHSLRQFGIEE